jgi:hypothetical protein
MLWIMKAVAVPLLLFTTIVYGQPANDSAIVARMTSNLLVLKSVLISSEPLQDEVYTPAELQSLITYSQHKVVQGYQTDLGELQFRHNRTVRKLEDGPMSFGTFFSRDQAYKLTSALAGKDLSEGNLTPLVEGIVGMAVSAVECRNTSSLLPNSAAFRSSAEKALTALQALGLSSPDLRVVVDALFRGAMAAAASPIRSTYK